MLAVSSVISPFFDFGNESLKTGFPADVSIFIKMHCCEVKPKNTLHLNYVLI